MHQHNIRFNVISVYFFVISAAVRHGRTPSTFTSRWEGRERSWELLSFSFLVERRFFSVAGPHLIANPIFSTGKVKVTHLLLSFRQLCNI